LPAPWSKEQSALAAFIAKEVQDLWDDIDAGRETIESILQVCDTTGGAVMEAHAERFCLCVFVYASLFLLSSCAFACVQFVEDAREDGEYTQQQAGGIATRLRQIAAHG
jgi:hypothetical protein